MDAVIGNQSFTGIANIAQNLNTIDVGNLSTQMISTYQINFSDGTDQQTAAVGSSGSGTINRLVRFYRPKYNR